MSWSDHIVERQIAEAMARGELDTPEHLRGKPLDLDTPRGEGWWAEQFVRKERSRLLRDDLVTERAICEAGFWRAGTLHELTTRIIDANKWIVGVNQRLLPADALALFEPAEVITTWRSVGPASL